jgi:hypothetical protein
MYLSLFVDWLTSLPLASSVVPSVELGEISWLSPLPTYGVYVAISALILLLAYAWGLYIVMVNSFNRPYKTRQRKTNVRCPVNGSFLTESELYFGHCFRCNSKDRCKKLINENRGIHL